MRKAAARDTLAPRDSARADGAQPSTPRSRAAPDTLQTPIARPYAPRPTELGTGIVHWDRDAIFASGALTLGELLDQVPGVTGLTTGFILAPQVAAWYGDPAGVRIFVDGVERDPLNARNGGITDLAAVPLWAMEDVRVERTARELRVHLRSWRVERTAPSTRTDVLTGSENLNLYRGWFGARLSNGGAIQFAAQQHSSASRGGMDGDAMGAMARVGWARGRWSVDGTLLRQGLDRASGARYLATTPVPNALPGFKGSEGTAYLRVAWRDPEAPGPWVQLTAATISAGESRTTAGQGAGSGQSASTTAATDSVDSTAVRSQYVVAAGFTQWGVRLSTTNRLRSINGRSFFSPGARAEYESRLFTLSAFGERGPDSTTRTDVQARVAPFSWLNVGASLSRASPKHAGIGPTVTAARVEAGVRIFDRWLTAGVVTRSAGRLDAPVELDTVLRAVDAPAASATIVGFRGPLWRGVSLDVDAINWDAPGSYRPQQQVRARLWFASSFLRRFPRNTFHLLAAGTYDYRSTTLVPSGTDPYGQRAMAAGALGSLLEIRIGSAVISWQTRNMLAEIYETYPGYVMPRLVNVYGVRWEFWN
ncbi:MAG TPA: Plug domain-containing protein [Gemmatimonadaceae bacterium]|nr:Plug domain-containing protein [Gemmatimonadaceae bacterium]